eukprot:4775771-Amphidinium_carterae.1
MPLVEQPDRNEHPTRTMGISLPFESSLDVLAALLHAARDVDIPDEQPSICVPQTVEKVGPLSTPTTRVCAARTTNSYRKREKKANGIMPKRTQSNAEQLSDICVAQTGEK